MTDFYPKSLKSLKHIWVDTELQPGNITARLSDRIKDDEILTPATSELRGATIKSRYVDDEDWNILCDSIDLDYMDSFKFLDGSFDPCKGKKQKSKKNRSKVKKKNKAAKQARKRNR